MAEYFCEPISEGSLGWTKLGALAHAYEELAQAKRKPEAVTTVTRGVKNTGNEQKEGIGFQLPKLAAGEKVILLQLVFFANTTALVSFSGTVTGEGAASGLTAKTVKPGEKTAQWWLYGQSGLSALWTQAELEEKAGSEGFIKLLLTAEKAASQEVNAAYIRIVTEGGEAPKVAGAVTGGAVAAATTKRISQPSAAGASGVTAGASVAIGALVKTEHGPQAAKVTTGAVVAATLARQARASAATSAGANVAAQTSRIATRAAAVSSGASVRASAQRVSQPLTRVSGGAVVTATIRRVAKVTAAVTAGGSVTASTHGRQAIRAAISAGASVYATVTRVGQAEEPPTSTPIAGHVAIGQRGTIGVHRGRLATGNVGRAER